MAERGSIVNNQWFGTSKDDRVDPLHEFITNGVTYFDTRSIMDGHINLVEATYVK
jgi:hypothetical protein